MRRVFPLCLAFALVTSVAEAQPDSQFFDSDGVQIHYTDQGAGEPVVLIHGFTSSLERLERTGLAPRLATSGYRVVSLDVRGHGRSGKPHDSASYGTKTLDDVVALLDHLELPQAHLVGYSMGGGMILAFLREHQDRALSVVIGGFGVLLPSEVAARVDGAASAEALEAFLVDSAGRALFSEIAARNDIEALAALRRTSGDMYVTPKTLVPIAAIVGGDDPFLANVERLADLRPATQVTVLPGH